LPFVPTRPYSILRVGQNFVNQLRPSAQQQQLIAHANPLVPHSSSTTDVPWTLIDYFVVLLQALAQAVFDNNTPPTLPMGVPHAPLPVDVPRKTLPAGGPHMQMDVDVPLQPQEMTNAKDNELVEASTNDGMEIYQEEDAPYQTVEYVGWLVKFGL